MLFGVLLVVLMSLAVPASGEDKRLELVNLLADASDEAVETTRWPTVSEDGGGRKYGWGDGNFGMDAEAGRKRIHVGYRKGIRHSYEAWDATFGIDTPCLQHGEMEGVCRKKSAFTAEDSRELALEGVMNNRRNPPAVPVDTQTAQGQRQDQAADSPYREEIMRYAIEPCVISKMNPGPPAEVEALRALLPILHRDLVDQAVTELTKTVRNLGTLAERQVVYEFWVRVCEAQ